MAPNQCKGASRYQPTEIHRAGLAVFLCLSLSLAADSKMQKRTVIVSRLLTKKKTQARKLRCELGDIF